MRMSRIGYWALVVAALAVLSPAAAFAQSAIAGVVRDEGGGVLPGVMVEASSPVLIEKTRTAVTGSDGRYRIINLRTGTYTVTFKLDGFQVFKREGIELSADFTAPVNVALKLGTLNESITVVAASPTVDTRSATVQEVASREMLDALPTGRTWQSVAQGATAVIANRPDMAGIEAVYSTTLSVHGSLGGRDQMVYLDGMDTANGDSDGRFQGWYRDDADNEEIAYSTSAQLVETPRGGVTISLVGRQGGNTMKGTAVMAETPGRLQSNNITAALKAKGLPTAEQVDRLYDYNVSMGGPAIKDRMWYFGSFRWWAVNKFAAGAFLPDGSPAPSNNRQGAASMRLTTQLRRSNKLMVYFAPMLRRDLFNRGVGPTTAPEAASHQFMKGPTFALQAKWTATLGSKLLFEAGAIANYAAPALKALPEVIGDATKIPHVDLITNRQTVGMFAGTQNWPAKRRTYLGTISYVTGSHTFKAGGQVSEGFVNYNSQQGPQDGSLIQEYRNGVPTSVTVRAVPADQPLRIRYDGGLFAQDSWTKDRLTLNFGVRFEALNVKMEEVTIPAGRFVAARHFNEIENLPNWKDFVPRANAVFDLFGNAKSALKVSASKYMWGESVGFARSYVPTSTGLSDRRTWNDLNGDDIAQEREIGPANIQNFGTRQTNRPDPGMKRPYNMEYTVTLQQEVMPRVSVSAGWFYRKYFRMIKSTNELVGFNDYTPVTIVSPLDGQPITVYNLDPAKRGLVSIVDTNSDQNTRTYSGFDLSFNARMSERGFLRGGLSVGKTAESTCDVVDPNLLRFCDHSSLVPYQASFKLSGNYSLPLNFQFSGTWQSLPGVAIPVAGGALAAYPEGGRRALLLVTRALIPNLTQPSLNVRLNEPGSKYFDRLNQVDVRINRRFRVTNRVSVDGNIDMFNILNSSVVQREVETWGSAFEQPLEIPQGRLFRFSVQVGF